MMSMPAFGAATPWAEVRAYGSTLEQASGLPMVTGWPDDPPTMNHIAYGDPIGGLSACPALLTALLHRQRTGEGQFIDLQPGRVPVPAGRALADRAVGDRPGLAAHRQPAPDLRAARLLPLRRPRRLGGDRGDRRCGLARALRGDRARRTSPPIRRSPPPPAGARSRTSWRRRSPPGPATRSPDEAMEALQAGRRRRRRGARARRSAALRAASDGARLLAGGRAAAHGLVPAAVAGVPRGRRALPDPPRRPDARPVEPRGADAGILGLSAAELDRLEAAAVIGEAPIPASQRKPRSSALIHAAASAGEGA